MTRPVEGFLTDDGLFFEEELHAVYHETVSTFKAEIYNFLEASNAPPEAREDVYQVFLQFTKSRRAIVLSLCRVLGELKARDEAYGSTTEGGEGGDPRIRLHHDPKLDREADAEGAVEEVHPEVGDLPTEPGEEPRPVGEMTEATESVEEEPHEYEYFEKTDGHTVIRPASRRK